jgi:hypothetical protein
MGHKRVIVVGGDATLLRKLLEREDREVVVLEIRAPPPLPDLTDVEITPKRGVSEPVRNKKRTNKRRAARRGQRKGGR